MSCSPEGFLTRWHPATTGPAMRPLVRICGHARWYSHRRKFADLSCRGSLTWPGQHAGFSGPKYDPWQIMGDPNKPDFRVNNLTLATGLDAMRLDGRQSLLSQFNQQQQRLADGCISSIDERAGTRLFHAHIQSTFPGVSVGSRTRGGTRSIWSPYDRTITVYSPADSLKRASRSCRRISAGCKTGTITAKSFRL